LRQQVVLDQRKALLDDVEGLLHLSDGHDQRRAQRQDVAHRDLEAQASLQREVEHLLGGIARWFSAVAVVHQLDSHQAAPPSHV